jgi:hypothetical protein
LAYLPLLPSLARFKPANATARRAVAPLRYSAVPVTPGQVAGRAARTDAADPAEVARETKLPQPKPRVAAEVHRHRAPSGTSHPRATDCHFWRIRYLTGT